MQSSRSTRSRRQTAALAPAEAAKSGGLSNASRSRAVALAILFASGWAGLVYEISWIRRASLVFGSTTLAVSTVTAVFLLGLALGAWIFGRLAPRIDRPFRIVALLEVGVAVLGLLSLAAFGAADAIYSAAYSALRDRPVLLFGSRALIACLVILPPTILMGGTLPLYCRQFVSSSLQVARPVGLLYGVNTLGAAMGCAAAGLWWLPQLGLRTTIVAAALMNVCVGAAAFFLTAPAPSDEAPATHRHAQARREPLSSRFLQPAILSMAFAAGFVALGTEVLWTRFLGLLMPNTVYTYTITLSVVLLGIVVGSLLIGGRSDRWRSRALAFGLLQVLTAVSTLVVMTLPPSVWTSLGKGTSTFLLLLLPPSILSGAAFPLAVRLLVQTASMASSTVGQLVAVNTIGAVIGSFVVGFVGLPMMGMQVTLLFLTGLSLAVGVAAWLLIDTRTSAPVRIGLAAAGVLAWFVIPELLATRLPQDYLATGDGRLVAYQEGVMSTVAAVQQDDVLRLDIDRLWQGENRKNHQALAAHIPMLLHPAPRQVLVVGAGAGQTPSRVLMYDVDYLACVDIEPAVFDVIREHFDAAWMSDRRVELIREDGRNLLAHSRRGYDVISLELGQVHRPGVAFFYTSDFYARARARLNPGGYVSQFIPLAFFTADQLQSVVRTFLTVFPQSILWYNTSELLLIGTNGETLRPDLARLDRLLQAGPIAEDLAYSHWGGPDVFLHHRRAFLAGFLMSSSGLDVLARDGSIYRDDRPVLDYAVQDLRADQTREIPLARLIRQHLEPATAIFSELKADELLAIERIRDGNLGDIETTAHFRRAYNHLASGGLAEAVRELSEGVRSNPENFDTRVLLGQVLVRQGRPEEATQHYREAVRIRPADALAAADLGTALLSLNRVDEAIPWFQASLALRSDDADSHNNLGVAFLLKGNFSDAIHAFEEALRLRPGSRDAMVNLARARTGLDATAKKEDEVAQGAP